MEIANLVSFKDFLDPVRDSKTQTGTLLMFTERDGSGFTKIRPGKKITAIVGPEGGWEDSELELAREKDFALVTFGGRVLRAETAAISITAILQHRFGDMS
jgi:16S rRNA (uracil1498-N3)-methyltransferase